VIWVVCGFVSCFLFAVAGLRALSQPRRVVIIRPPRTWREFTHSPLPYRADNVPLRRDDPAHVANVYNHAAALQRLSERP
jgi:hypothetical protein